MFRPASRKALLLAAGLTLLVALGLAAGCSSSLGYYAQSIEGHMALLDAARPIGDVVADPSVSTPLKQRLERAQQMRAFASAELALPDNASYTRYADLKRPYAVWNVFATPELSLQLRQWCYPVVGCAGYRGYFDRADADAAAAELRAQGYEVNVAGVPAYSTLGWFADPLLSTFIGGNEGQVAGLIFHELAHQELYVSGDTTFNESFATTVEREGVRRWLAAHGDDASRLAYAEFAQRRAQFLELLLRYRKLLQANYESGATPEEKRARKQQLFDDLQRDYAQLKEQWGGFTGYDRFFATGITNAHLAAVGAYNDWVPAFSAMLTVRNGDFVAFYQEVRRLAALPRAERDSALTQMNGAH